MRPSQPTASCHLPLPPPLIPARLLPNPRLQEFPDGGTTNGASWYPIYGSMQDWSYVVGHCLELTLELR
jgi:hypothetical protein